VKPWTLGRIGKIEKHVSLKMIVADRDFTTGELARAIYADPMWDQDFRLRDKGDPPPKLKSWQYDRVRRAAPTFADPVGRATSKGRPWLWRLRDKYLYDVSKKKTARDAAQRRLRHASKGKGL
jgi:hypothetical protein